MASERIILGQEKKSELVNQHFSRYEFAGGIVPGKSVLDIACGSGYGSKLLADAGASRVLGVDISREALQYAGLNHAGDRISYSAGDAEAIPLDGPFDVIVSFETIEHLRHPERFLEESVRLLGNGGSLIISTPIRLTGTIAERPINPFHVREWSTDEFVDLLRGYFGSIEVFAQFNYRKNPVPYSRSIKRLFTRLFMPGLYRKINQFEVLADCTRYSWFSMEPVYVIAVCKKMGTP